MKKKSKSLLYQLGVSYIALLVLVLAAFGMSFLYFMSDYEKDIKDGEKIIVKAEDILNDQGNLKEDIAKGRGKNTWVELLDGNLKVIQVKGNKSDSVMQYTREVLEQITYRDKNIFYATLLEFQNKQGNHQYCLIKYQKGIVSFNMELSGQEKVLQIFDERGRLLNIILFKAIILFLGLCAIDIILLGLWVNYKVKKPLNAITQGLTKMREGDYTIHMDFKAIRDFEIIKDSFNEMTEALNQSIKEKEAVHQSKRHMLLDLSHDIKTPIASIKGYASALNDELVIGEEKKKKYYKTILLKTERISNLVDALFDLLKLENKDYKLDLTCKDLCEVLRECIVEYYEEIEERGFQLVIELPEVKYLVEVDEMLFKRAIGNLILNALKYNKEGTKLTIKVEENKGCLKVIIADDGLGVPENIEANIFEAFVRGDNARKTSGGTGLGLAIVKVIMERHGWYIHYVPCDKGSLFEIVLKNEDIDNHTLS